MTKIVKTSPKYPLGERFGGLTKKNLQKALTHQYKTLKSIFQKIEKKLTLLGPFSTVQTSEAEVRGVGGQIFYFQ